MCAEPIKKTSLLPNINILDALIIIRNRWRIGLAAATIAATLAAALVLNQEPLYQSSAKITVEFNPEKIIQINDVARNNLNQNARFYDSIVNTYLERLRSRSMAQVVLENLPDDKLKLLRNLYPDSGTYLSESGKEIPKLQSLIRQTVQIAWNAKTQIIKISGVSGHPEVSQLVVDGYAEGLILLQGSRISDRTDQILQFLESQSEGLQEKLEDGENQLQQYRADNNIVTIRGNIDLVDEKLGQLGTALNERKVELLGKKNQLDQVEAAGDNLEALLDISFIASRPRVEALSISLDEAESTRALLSKTYGRRHPRMVENQSELSTRENLLRRAVYSVIEEIRNDYLVAQASYETLQEEVKATEAEALELDRLAIEYRVLERKLDVQKQIFDVVARQFTTADISSQFDLASIQLLDGASLPQAPFTPDPKRAYTLAAALFLLCFVSVPLLLELMDNRLKSFADVENFVQKPIYGDLKRFSNKSEKELDQAIINNDEDLIEPFRGIYSSLKLQAELKPPFGLIVTSSVPSEGKSFVASNLGAVFARHNLKTILIDCDLRRPSIHRGFNLKNDLGLLEWIESGNTVPSLDELEQDSTLRITKIKENFSVLSSGGSTREPTEVIGSERFNRIMSRIKEAFDVVIIDTPPSGLFPDAALVADFADNTLFVAKQKEVTRQKVRFAVNRLERTNAPVVGVVLNQISDGSVVRGYGNSYYGENYSYAYGYERDQEKYRKYYEEKA